MYIGTEKSGSRTAHFYENTGGGVFTDATTAMNVGETNTAFAISWGDYDGDGDIDLFVGNTATGAANKLYRNEGPDGGGGWNAFVDKASDVGITPTRECSAAAFADYNNARHDVLQCVLQFLNPRRASIPIPHGLDAHVVPRDFSPTVTGRRPGPLRH